jgi:hypothetical protein
MSRSNACLGQLLQQHGGQPARAHWSDSDSERAAGLGDAPPAARARFKFRRLGIAAGAARRCGLGWPDSDGQSRTCAKR